jgi:predicted NBD/HSP70 family sugar kinase
MNAPRSRLRLSGTNLKRVADHNQRITLHAIRVHGPLTRMDLARITGLTPPAIANITRRLLADGLIEEAGRIRGGRGSPPANLVIVPEACFSIGLNVDRDHISVVLVNFVGQIMSRRSSEAAFALPDEVAAFFRKSVTDMLADAEVELGQVIGIGVASPDDLGFVDLPGRSVDYGSWDSVDWKALFGEPFGLPVFVENDSAAAAMGEQQLGLGQKYPSFFYLLISWGLGGGIVLDGSYFRGADGRSGEIGFLPSADGQGQIQSHVSMSGLTVRLQAQGATLADLTNGDPTAERVAEIWLEDAVRRLREPLAAVNCLINPAAVLIGGRLPSHMLDRLVTALQSAQQLEKGSLPAVAPVERAMLAEDAPAVGAAILPFTYFLLPTSTSLWKTVRSSQEAV